MSIKTNATRKMYRENYGPIPKGYHIHHIIPRWKCDHLKIEADFPENLIALTRLGHILAHQRMFKMTGNPAEAKALELLGDKSADTSGKNHWNWGGTGMVGKANPSYGTGKKYSLIHKSGIEFCGTLKELMRAFPEHNIAYQNLHGVATKKYGHKSVKGWRLNNQ